MRKLKLLLLYGGVSEEHAVSVKSAQELSRNLDAEKYDPVYVFVSRNGLWLRTDAPVEDPEVSVIVAPLTDWKNKGLVTLRNGRYERLAVDVAFPMLHGKYGEDGTVQGVLEMAGIPYVGCGIAASALCMDKELAYLAAARAGVRVPRHRVICRDDAITADGLEYPLFVKPARSGSSFGVSKVCRQAELAPAVQTARLYDNKVLLEEAISGSEIGCAALGNGESLTIGALDQIELSGGFFHIHQEKSPETGSENAVIRVPAPVAEETRVRITETAKRVYRALGCRGLARVDLFLTPDEQLVLNEVNTMPGFTSYSRYPRMMAGAGVSLGEVIDRLIALAWNEGGNGHEKIHQ